MMKSCLCKPKHSHQHDSKSTKKCRNTKYVNSIVFDRSLRGMHFAQPTHPLVSLKRYDLRLPRTEEKKDKRQQFHFRGDFECKQLNRLKTER